MMLPVVSPQEIARVEKLACLEGCREEEFMEKAGRSIAALLEQFIQGQGLSRHVTILSGKGNNGGDGFVAACHLLQKGFTVQVYVVYGWDQIKDLCHKQAKRFLHMGGKVTSFSYDLVPPKDGIIVDALVGTGFTQIARGELAQAITWINAVSVPIIAVDIPSGLCGATGCIGSVAVHAMATIYLEYPKIGFFLRQGWETVGQLWKGQFGLPQEYQRQIHAEAYLACEERSGSFLPSLERTRNKYTAGQVIAFAGSTSMMGAAMLSAKAALRAGAGMVKNFHLGTDVYTTSDEVICQTYIGHEQLFWQEMKRTKALLVGPGLGRDAVSFTALRNMLPNVHCPVVLDADALIFLAKHPECSLPRETILTPHKGELKQLLGVEHIDDLFSLCQSWVDDKHVCLLVKGAPSFLFMQQQKPVILPFGNQGMATAGSGDVLSGIIVALLAQGVTASHAVELGCCLHGLAGDFACAEKTAYSVIASDLIAYLPKAFKKVMPGRVQKRVEL